MVSLQIGVLAEDENDCDVIAVLARRVLLASFAHGRPVTIRRRFGRGSGNLKRKAAAWMRELSDDGFNAAVVVHDLDRDAFGNLNDEAALVRLLSEVPTPRGLERLICIPVEEIEAWFFSSVAVLERIGARSTAIHASPHLIERPKERLIEFSRGANRKPRYSQNDNPALAELLDLDACAALCPAFHRFREFLITLKRPKGRRPSKRIARGSH